MRLKFSILTPSYNQGKYLEENILSVLNQNYNNFEHIIVDGGSTDNTLNILKKYKHLKWISEPDNGQADALNKGLKLVTGNIIGWINSDDYYLPNVFHEVKNVFNDNHVEWLVSNIIAQYTDSRKYLSIKDISYTKLIKNPDIVKQPGAFYRDSIIKKVNSFNDDLLMVMDYDLWLKISKIANPYKLNSYTAVFRHHENQKTNNKNIIRQYKEIKKILKNENVSKYRLYKIAYKKYKSYYKNLLKTLLKNYK